MTKLPGSLNAFLYALCLLCLRGCVCDDDSQLRTHQLHEYDPKVPPKSPHGPIKVTVGLIVTHFSLAETDNEFEANVWFSVTWKDERLAWNISSNASSIKLRFETGEIWQPDITLINNAVPTETFHYGASLLTVDPDGTVLWSPPAKLVSYCSVNMIRWPYDEHTCTLKIGSWTHSGKEIELETTPNEESTDNNEHYFTTSLDIPNSEWNLLSSKVKKSAEQYACCSNPYSVVTYSFRIQRNSPSYVATIILPIFVITLVNVMVFMLPPTAGEKITLASVNLLIVCMFLIYFEARLPSMGDHLPLLVFLYSCNAVLIGISLILSVVVLNLSRNRKASSPPQCCRLFCNANFASYLGLGYIVPYVSQTHSRLDEGVEMRPTRDQGRSSFDLGFDKDDHTAQLVTDNDVPALANAEWILLAATIDRLALIIYVIVSGLLLGLCLA